MKKLAFILAVLLVVGIVMAQNKVNIVKVEAPPTGTKTAANSDAVVCPTDIGCQVSSQHANYTNRSTTIATGGASQTLMSSNSSRLGVFIQNPCSETESLFINFTSAASTTAGTGPELISCASFTFGVGPLSTEAITVNAATTGHKIIAKEQ